MWNFDFKKDKGLCSCKTFEKSWNEHVVKIFLDTILKLLFNALELWKQQSSSILGWMSFCCFVVGMQCLFISNHRVIIYCCCFCCRTSKVSLLTWDVQQSVLESSNFLHDVKPKPHSKCEAWWRVHHGLGLLSLVKLQSVNSKFYKKSLQENVMVTTRHLKLKRTEMMQRDNDPKHASKSTTESML